MRQVLKLHNYKITKLHNPPNSQRGYMLITLMLVIALAAMAALAILPEIGQQIRRDREEEMRHRGTAYMRAIQHFYRKIGRYPVSVDELENTNKIRFLRKRYKDPVNRDPQTGKERDFKLLHMQDVSLNNGPVMPGATVPGQGGLSPGVGGGLPALQGGALGQGGALAGALGQMQQLGGMQQPGGIPQPGSPPGTLNNAEGEESENPANPQGNSSSSSSSPFSSSPNPSASSSGGGSLSGQVFGGGPILGVASTSKEKSIREFNKKNHYNDWLFIYDPTTDTGGLLVGPWQTPPTNSIPGATPAGQPLPGGQPAPSGPGISQPFGGQPQNPPAQPPQTPQQNSPEQ